MARQLRIQYEGAIYHLLNRGDRREDIFLDEADRSTFLEALGAACLKTGWQVHAYCLMTNHFHLVVETPRPNLVAGMKWLLGTYTIRFNRRHRFSGHLFAGRYKSLLVDESDRHYLRTVCDYVHLNPVRAGMVAEGEKLESYRWSSYLSYLRPTLRPKWLRCDRLLGEHGIDRESRRSRLEFGRRTEARRRDAQGPDEAMIRRGWRFGADDFVARLLDRCEAAPSEHHRGIERAETDEQKAERMVRAALAEMRWQEDELARRRKSDPIKLRLARRLRHETAVSLKWIARRLEMGTWTHVSNLMRKESVSSTD
ncbi:MAG TPA: transposase [Chthoniobacterales bacterium]|nr:transposase [Chthoniobacterales bacterium]